MTNQAATPKLIGLVVFVMLLTVSTNSSCGRPFNYAVHVRAEGTGEDVPNAEVRIDTRDGQAPLYGVTDAGGFARIPVDIAYMGHDAELYVKAAGYIEHTKEIDFTESNPTKVVLLQPETVTPTPTATPTQTPSPASASTVTATWSPSPTPTPTPTPSPTPTMTPSPTPVPSHTPTPTSIPTPTLTPLSTSPSLATAIQGSSIYIAPASSSQVLGGISVGEKVPVLGRSAVGQWFYVCDDQGVEGFVYAPRFDWQGDYDSLPVKRSAVTGTPATATPTSTSSLPFLEIELWDIDGTEHCSDAMWFKSVYINGRGGDGVYTYYWNGELLAGPTKESFTLEMHTTGGAIVGTGKVVSGDGQVAEKGLQITVPACAQ